MKKTFFIFTLMLITIATSFAQETAKRERLVGLEKQERQINTERQEKLISPKRQEKQGRQQRQHQRMTVDERVEMMTKWMTEELSLEENQVAPVDSINRLYIEAQQILFETAGEDRSGLRDAMQALEKEKEKSLKDVLTDEQLEKYKKAIEERRKQMQERSRNR